MCPDIAKCGNTKCKSKDKCYRFTSIANEYQSYEDFKPKKGRVKCEYFMEIWKS